MEIHFHSTDPFLRSVQTSNKAVARESTRKLLEDL